MPCNKPPASVRYDHFHLSFATEDRLRGTCNVYVIEGEAYLDCEVVGFGVDGRDWRVVGHLFGKKANAISEKKYHCGEEGDRSPLELKSFQKKWIERFRQSLVIG